MRGAFPDVALEDTRGTFSRRYRKRSGAAAETFGADVAPEVSAERAAFRAARLALSPGAGVPGSIAAP